MYMWFGHCHCARWIITLTLLCLHPQDMQSGGPLGSQRAGMGWLSVDGHSTSGGMVSVATVATGGGRGWQAPQSHQSRSEWCSNHLHVLAAWVVQFCSSLHAWLRPASAGAHLTLAGNAKPCSCTALCATMLQERDCLSSCRVMHLISSTRFSSETNVHVCM
jgi:hypothetical protein